MINFASMRAVRTFLLLAVVAYAFAIATWSYAQVAGANLSGTVTDPSGAVIPNAQVSIKNTATGITEAQTTNSRGLYAAPNLLAGVYDVTATAAGFSTVVQRGITLTVGAQQVLNLEMKVGLTTETVNISSEAPTVQLASSSLSADVDSKTIRELPLNGRDWASLAVLQPGVSDMGGDQRAVTRRGHTGYGTQLSISGTRPVQNNYRLDGISINDYSNGAPGSVLGVNLGVDAIQEFSVLTSNYSAEYGKTSGGVVNAITKSGTNQFHGSAYEFIRNSALDARSFFDVGTIPPYRRNQFGVSGGGPIRKDRTFIFADYEGVRSAKGTSTVANVPSAAARSGKLCSVPGTPPVCTPTQVTVDPAAQKYLGMWPLPNGSLLPGGDAGRFIFAGVTVINENFFTSRLDHKISDSDSVFGTYLIDYAPYTSPDNLDNIITASNTHRQLVVLEENHVFSPRFVNTVRGGFNRAAVQNANPIQALNPVTTDKSLAAQPGQNPPSVTVAGLGAGSLTGQTSTIGFAQTQDGCSTGIPSRASMMRF